MLKKLVALAASDKTVAAINVVVAVVTLANAVNAFRKSGRKIGFSFSGKDNR